MAKMWTFQFVFVALISLQQVIIYSGLFLLICRYLSYFDTEYFKLSHIIAHLIGWIFLPKSPKMCHRINPQNTDSLPNLPCLPVYINIALLTFKNALKGVLFWKFKKKSGRQLEILSINPNADSNTYKIGLLYFIA